MLKPLKYKDIEEKVQINIKEGMTLQGMRDSLERELFEFQRVLIQNQIQIQNLIEQIAYVDKKISGKIKE